MAWRFVFKELVPRDESEVTYIMPSYMKPEYHTLTYYHDAIKMDYQSPGYDTKLEMMETFHSLVELTGQKPIINFYKDKSYIANGREMYEKMVLQKKGVNIPDSALCKSV